MPRIKPDIRLTARPYSKRSNIGWNGAGTFSQESYWRNYWGGEPTPGYPRRMTDHYHAVSLRKTEPGSFYVRRDTLDGKGYDEWTDSFYGGSIGNVPKPSGSKYEKDWVVPIPQAIRLANERAMDAVVDQKVNLAQAFAERAKTVNLIEGTAERLARSIYWLKHGNFKEAQKALGYNLPDKKRKPRPPGSRDNEKTLSEDWLALQYGWKPLLSDVKGAAEKLASTMLRNPPLIRARGKAKLSEPGERYDISTYLTQADFLPVGTFSWVWSDRTTEARTELRFQSTNEFIRQGKNLGITDPLTLAWELVPYSFVVDWFYPIGDFLKRLNYDSGLQYVSGYSSYHTVQQLMIDALPSQKVQKGNYYVTQTPGGTWSRDLLHFERLVLTSPPRPTWPGFEDPFTPTRVLNALSLMSLAFNRNPRRFS